ncbi:MAG: hypothetical protein ACR2IV_02365 [Bryobacteraceae bacterium]
MNSANVNSGAHPKHGLALDTDVENEALVASGPQPKHGAAAALSVGAAGAGAEAVINPSVDSESEGVNT